MKNNDLIKICDDNKLLKLKTLLDIDNDYKITVEKIQNCFLKSAR